MSDIVRSVKCNPATTDTPTSFFSLPSELRNKIYELIVLHQKPITPWPGCNRREQLTTGLLRANKAVHGEASSLLYGQNRFDFTAATPEEIVSFFDQIGGNNTGLIRHILIDFPRFLYLDPEDVTLEDSSVIILANLQSRCTNLTTLTTSLRSTDAMELILDNLDHYKIATEALRLVDICLRTISSLQKIILEVYEDGPSDYIRREMKALGWTICTTEYVEEEDWGRGFSDLDDDDYGYGDDDYSYGDDDDYDIDNDSDFWRRAAD